MLTLLALDNMEGRERGIPAIRNRKEMTLRRGSRMYSSKKGREETRKAARVCITSVTEGVWTSGERKD
jgi:hypothetical protein